jgi:hypothetical protein
MNILLFLRDMCENWLVLLAYIPLVHQTSSTNIAATSADHAQFERGQAMELDSVGTTFALVIRLHQGSDGTWRIEVDGPQGQQEFGLNPATLLVQLWRSGDKRILRGSVSLHGTEQSVSIQSNAQLVDLLQTWLTTSQP